MGPKSEKLEFAVLPLRYGRQEARVAWWIGILKKLNSMVIAQRVNTMYSTRDDLDWCFLEEIAEKTFFFLFGPSLALATTQWVHSAKLVPVAPELILAA